jgi:hypothetical protein
LKETSKESPKKGSIEIEGDIVDEKKDSTISNIQTIKDVLIQEKGDTEAWRCILPTGTIIRYKDNGDAQVSNSKYFNKLEI